MTLQSIDTGTIFKCTRVAHSYLDNAHPGYPLQEHTRLLSKRLNIYLCPCSGNPGPYPFQGVHPVIFVITITLHYITLFLAILAYFVHFGAFWLKHGHFGGPLQTGSCSYHGTKKAQIRA